MGERGERAELRLEQKPSHRIVYILQSTGRYQGDNEIKANHRN
jgi:hypothetical protein